jgi:hypothetical protein
MARGWESKSVEEQQSLAAGSGGSVPAVIPPQQAARRSQLEGLALSRQHVLEQLQKATSPIHRNMLQRALADLEARIQAPG